MDAIMVLLFVIMAMVSVLLVIEIKKHKSMHYPPRQLSEMLPDKMHMKPYNKRPLKTKPVVNDDEKQWMKEHDLK